MAKTKEQPIAFESKSEHRFVITLPPEFEIPSFCLYHASRPNVIFDNGVCSYHPVSLIFYDPVCPSTSQRLWDVVVGLTDFNVEEVYELGRRFNYDDLKEKFEKFKDGFDYTLEMVDPFGTIVESWDVIGCKILRIDFGQLDYGSNERVKCTMVVQPKHFRLNF